MKKYLVLFFLLASLTSFGQFSNYTNINGRYKWIAGKFDSTFTLPSGTTPSLRVGGGTGPGAMFYRTTDSTIYQYTGTQWIKLRSGVSPTDTAGIWLTNIYRKPGSDSVFYVKGGSSTFAFRDSVGNAGGGGGGGKIYYFNGGVSMGTIGGFTMYELGDTANTGAAANFTRATTGNLANFITDPGKPGLLQIPAGVWTVDAYLSETGGGANHAQIWIEVEKWDGSTITTIATSPIEEITNGSVIDLYNWSVSIPTTSLAITDRIIIQFYITNTNGKTVTLYTQNGYVGEVHTTFTTGIGSLNGLTAPSQFFATGTSGTDFNIASATATHTFNLPTASGTNRGALSSADWTTFNGKVSGSGTTNYLSKWTSSSALGNSLVFDNGTSVGVNTASPSATYKLDISGATRITDNSANALVVDLGLTGVFKVLRNSVAHLQYDANTFTTTAYQFTSQNFNTYASNTSRISGGVLQFTSSAVINAISQDLPFQTSGTERMRLTANGRLLLGTAVESTYELDVVGDIRSTLDANINGLTVGKGGGSVASNTAFGFEAINASATGVFNTVLGYTAGRSLTSGYENTFVGYNAGRSNTTGYNNVSVGGGSGFRITTGALNTNVGQGAGDANIVGNGNVNIGYQAGFSGTSDYNINIGTYAGRTITTGQYNIMMGFYTGQSITTGNYNTIIGHNVTGLSASLSNTIILADGQGNQRLYINNTGLTGLGITSPANALHIDRGNATASYLQFTAGTTTGQTATDGFEVGIDASGNGVINQQENLPMLFYTNNTERMRVTAAGRLLLGTSTESTFLLDVNGTARINGFVITDGTNKQLQIINDQATSADRGFALYQNNTGVQGAAMMFYKSRGSYAAPSNVASGDILAAFSFRPYITGYPVDQSLTGAVMTSTTGVSQFFITGTTASNYTPNLLIAHNGNIGIGSLGGTIITSLTLPTAKLQVRGSGATSSTTALLIENSSAAVSLFVNDAGQTGIGTTSPNASALLDITSTTKGFLPPRMTNAQMVAIATPAAGLVVYDTTNNKLNVYDGTNWVTLH